MFFNQMMITVLFFFVFFKSFFPFVLGLDSDNVDILLIECLAFVANSHVPLLTVRQTLAIKEFSSRHFGIDYVLYIGSFYARLL